jgi:hypothetical protein
MRLRAREAVPQVSDTLLCSTFSHRHLGELLIRHSLERAFLDLGITLDIIRSDKEFLLVNPTRYDIMIVDPWTWAGKGSIQRFLRMLWFCFAIGWQPKSVVVGQERKIYILDFFGSEKLLNWKPNFNIPPSRLLTAYPSPWNTFLGYYINATELATYSSKKKLQGVIWGKDPRHYENRGPILRQVAAIAPLHSTASQAVFKDSNIVWHGHQSATNWMKLLSESKFLIGLGDPLLGPSALDAISVGCMYINPIYKEPVRKIHKSQHEYASQSIGEPYVCNAHFDQQDEVLRCVNLALKTDLKPYIPPDFTYQSYLKRVRNIFLSNDLIMWYIVWSYDI